MQNFCLLKQASNDAPLNDCVILKGCKSLIYYPVAKFCVLLTSLISTPTWCLVIQLNHWPDGVTIFQSVNNSSLHGMVSCRVLSSSLQNSSRLKFTASSRISDWINVTMKNYSMNVSIPFLLHSLVLCTIVCRFSTTITRPTGAHYPRKVHSSQ